MCGSVWLGTGVWFPTPAWQGFCSNQGLDFPFLQMLEELKCWQRASLLGPRLVGHCPPYSAWQTGAGRTVQKAWGAGNVGIGFLPVITKQGQHFPPSLSD